MEIIRSEHMGLCFGVSAAINTCYDVIKHASNEKKKIYILGMLVHNEFVVNQLNHAGFLTITEEELLNNEDSLDTQDIVIIRAHGTTKEIYNILDKKGVKVYDATCIFVSKTRNALIEMEEKKHKILFIGDKEHPEVKGIISFGNNIEVYRDLEELKKASLDNKEKYTVLTQTTLNKKIFEEIDKYLKNNFRNINIFDKICGATQVRQQAAEALAQKVEVVLVVGGKNSSNTKKLYDIAAKINTNTYLMQDENDLNPEWFHRKNKIGVTSGASTPEEIIINIEKKLRGLSQMDNKETYAEFEALLNDYLPTEENARIKVTGTISQKDRNYIYLDVLGQRTSVRVRADELEGFEKGEQVEILLVGETDDGDFIIGSRRRILMEESNEKVEQAFETKEPIKIKLTKRIKGGFIGEYNGLQGFLPNSLSEIPQDSTENIEGREIDVIVKEIKGQKGAKGRKITFSKKDVTLAEASKEFDALQVGEEITGTISNIFDFGLAVKISNLKGFVHISEVSWKKLDKLTGQFNIGDEIKAKIIELEPEKRNVKLSIKATSKNPWETLAENYKIDNEVNGVVTKIVQYGIFVKILEGVEGLVHMSDFTWNKKRVRLDEFVKIGDEIKVKIIDLEPNDRKLKLGIKQLSQNPWETASEKYKVDATVTGIVAEIKPFGIFVEIEQGIDVFIHQTDFSWKGEENKNFVKGDTVEFKIVETDLENQKIKGSIKALTKSPWEKALEENKVGQIVEKEIKSVMDFGLFIPLSKGVDGFIPTQLASKDFVKDIKEKFKVGDVVKARIVEINNEKERIKLSIKKVEIDEENREQKELLEKYGTSSSESEEE